jgi:hypothetical protein
MRLPAVTTTQRSAHLQRRFCRAAQTIHLLALALLELQTQEELVALELLDKEIMAAVQQQQVATPNYQEAAVAQVRLEEIQSSMLVLE